jgi:cell division protein FtsN
MNPDHPDREPQEFHEIYDEEPPRSIFAATWFRGLLVLIVLGVVGAVAVPYVLDMMHQSPKPSTTAKAAPGGPTTESGTPPAPASATTAAVAPPSAPAPAPSPESARVQDAKPAPSEPAKPAAEPKTSGPTKSVAKTPAKRTNVAKATDARAKTDAPAKKVADAGAKSDAAPAKSAPAVAKASETKSASPDATPTRVAAATTTTAAPGPTTGDQFWVQVGAFRDESTAKRIIARLQEQNFKVEQTTRRSGGATKQAGVSGATGGGSTSLDRYDVLVSGMSAADLNSRLSAKGLSAENSSGGLVVRPSLSLRDAVALSKDLTVDGLKVQVRRTASDGAKAVTRGPTAVSPDAGSADTLYRVRVGAFPDRDGALTALRDLEAKGYKGYIARGNQ